jgi:succinyl-diaminopimelate desuccinylase
MTPNKNAERAGSHEGVLALCRALIRVPSENPGGDTRAIADVVSAALDHPAIELRRYEPQAGCVNVVAVLRGAAPGPRVVMNGHLDTYPVGPRDGWTHDPLGGELVDGRIWGRGAGDMKAGVAIMVNVMQSLAAQREKLKGELVLTLVADEETGGRWGTQWLLDQVPEARGDFVLNADAGHPRVVRYGEKGLLWLRLTSTGRACHGAHTHLGDNALESLLAAVRDLLALRDHRCELPPDVLASMEAARPVSEREGGAGEFDNLRGVTVNLGALHGGSVANLVPAQAQALLDIRYPPGLGGARMRSLIDRALAAHPKVRCDVIPGSETDPAWTAPDHLLVRTMLRNARKFVAPEAVANMRVGMTDTRLFRHAGMPAVVYGPTARNMGGIDEHVVAAEVTSVFDVHLATVTDLLCPDRDRMD